MTALAEVFPAAAPADLPEAYLLALVNAHAADDGDAVAALLALAGPPAGDPDDTPEEPPRDTD